MSEEINIAKCPGYIQQIFDNPDWHSGYITIFNSVNKRGTSLSANIKLTLDKTATFKDAALNITISLQQRLRNFDAQVNKLEKQMIAANIYDSLGFHDDLIQRVNQGMVRSQAHNPTWNSRFLRFGMARQTRFGFRPGKPGYEPLIPGIVAAYDPGTATFAIGIGETFIDVRELSKNVSPAQEAKNVIAAGFCSFKDKEYTTDPNQETAQQRLQRHMNKIIT
tara:strand:- start:112 stop:777 length:666 start_codon:yes stop_codon:yes gene_type:complete